MYKYSPPVITKIWLTTLSPTLFRITPVLLSTLLFLFRSQQGLRHYYTWQRRFSLGYFFVEQVMLLGLCGPLLHKPYIVLLSSLHDEMLSPCSSRTCLQQKLVILRNSSYRYFPNARITSSTQGCQEVAFNVSENSSQKKEKEKLIHLDLPF